MLFGPIRLALRIVAGLIVLVVVYFAVTLVQVYLTGRQYDPRPAGAIVVMGAAQYNGVPSPDLQARLSEALLLFHQGYAHLIMTTGYKQPGDRYTESEAGARYLEDQGVPAADVLQAGGNTTWESLSDAAPALRAHGVTVLLIATDPFHEDRCLAIATDLGFHPYPTPTRTSPLRGWSTAPYYLKETLGVGLGRIVGYQHLEWLHALG